MSTTFPIFLSYNTRATSPSAGGDHSNLNGSQLYIYSSFFDSNDVSTLSHEMGEITDDPFLSNIVPRWNNPQTPGTCSDLLEVGDPVDKIDLPPIVLNGFSYHLEDLTFLPWFAGDTPSTSVNGWYTFANTNSSPSTCSFQ